MICDCLSTLALIKLLELNYPEATVGASRTMTDRVDKEAYKEVLSSLSLTLTDINRDSKPAYGTTATKSFKKKARLSM